MAMLPSVNEKYFGQAFLDDIVQWIDDNLDLDEVFSKEYITDWARKNLTPEKVFDEDTLGEWAVGNGYKEE